MPRFQPCVLPHSWLGGERGLCCPDKLGWPGEGTEGLALLGHTQSMIWDRVQPSLWLIPELGQPSESWKEPWDDRRSFQLFL